MTKCDSSFNRFTTIMFVLVLLASTGSLAGAAEPPDITVEPIDVRTGSSHGHLESGPLERTAFLFG